MKTFSKKSIGSSRVPWMPTYSRHSKKWWPAVLVNRKKNLWILLLAFIAIGFAWAAIWLQINVISELPDIGEVENMIFSESTVITDKNDKVLYTLFSENRKYLPLEDISPYVINAMVAIEDQRYWDHNGLDAMGMLRAAITAVLRPWSRIQWASTIPQQLVRNLLLTRDRKIDRKLKEIFLTRKLDDVLQKNIHIENPWFTSAEVHQRMKEDVLELYLNYISLWNNAFGVEAASNTYFGTSVQNIWPLEASILASLPRWPSFYDPYRNRNRTMGTLVIEDPTWVAIQASTWLQSVVMDRVADIVNKSYFQNKNDVSELVRYVVSILSFRVDYQWNRYAVSYTNWRKDLVLSNMFVQWYITEAELKEALLRWFDFRFKSSAISIKAPHFVHWVTELLEEQYDKDQLLNWWFTVKTTLDLDIQEVAERVIRDNWQRLTTHNANNQAMLYLDSSNGDILAYVGSRNYFNDEIEWQNDMVRRKRQAGSSVKPFIYALWFQEVPLTLDTPIFDIPFEVWWDTPSNADWDFLWLLPLRQALAFSRNIPAIKMFFALGWEAVAKPFFKSLWMNSLSDTVEYGYPLALWAGEVEMLELATAYTHLSALGTPAKIDPILSITTRDWSILYEKEVEKEQQIIPTGIASLLRQILSNTANMPSDWVGMFSVQWLTLWIKSWTSDVKTPNGARPRDGRLAAYTPTKVALFWAWNTDAAPMNRNAFGGSMNGVVMRWFFRWLLENNYIANESLPNIETIDMSISKLSWFPISETTPSDHVVTTKSYVYNQPTGSDPAVSIIKYDVQCNGAMSPYTPTIDTRDGYLVAPISFMPNNMDIADIRLWWERAARVDTGWLAELSNDARNIALSTRYNYPGVFISEPTEMCPDRIPQDDPNISVEILQPVVSADIAREWVVMYRAQANTMLKEVIVFVNDVRVGNARYDSARELLTDIVPISIPDDVDGDVVLRVMAVNVAWFANSTTQTVSIVDEDVTAPWLENKSVTHNDDGTYTVRMYFVDALSAIVSVQVTRNGETLWTSNWSIVSFTTNSLDSVSVSVSDSYGNILNESIDLQ